MARKSKRKGRKPIPPQASGAEPPDTPMTRYFAKHPEPICVTFIGTNEAGEGVSIVSDPDKLANDLRLVELGMSVGKGKRRGSSPKTIRRNVEICDLRKKDAKHWSHTQLGRKYGMNKRSVSRILKNEEKWRELASKFPI